MFIQLYQLMEICYKSDTSVIEGYCFFRWSPADIPTSQSIAIEDGPAFRLPITVTLKDTSENITSLKLESSNLEEVLYLTRLQNLTLDAHNSSLNHLGDDLDLIIRFSGNFKTSPKETRKVN